MAIFSGTFLFVNAFILPKNSAKKFRKCFYLFYCRRVTINGEMFKVNPVKSDDNEWTYTCQYTTPAVPTKTGKRDTLHFTVDVSWSNERPFGIYEF